MWYVVQYNNLRHRLIVCLLSFSIASWTDLTFDMIYLLIKHKYIQRHTRRTRIAGATRLKNSPLFLWVWFYDGIWQTQAACIPNLKSLASAIAKTSKGVSTKFWGVPMATPTFSLGVISWWPLANPSCIPNLKSLTSTVAEILKGNRKVLGSFPRPGPRPLFFCVWFYDWFW